MGWSSKYQVFRRCFSHGRPWRRNVVLVGTDLSNILGLVFGWCFILYYGKSPSFGGIVFTFSKHWACFFGDFSDFFRFFWMFFTFYRAMWEPTTFVCLRWDSISWDSSPSNKPPFGSIFFGHFFLFASNIPKSKLRIKNYFLVKELGTHWTSTNVYIWIVHFDMDVGSDKNPVAFKTDDVKMPIPCNKHCFWSSFAFASNIEASKNLRQADTSSCVCNGGDCETAGCATTTGAARRNWSFDHFQKPCALVTITGGWHQSILYIAWIWLGWFFTGFYHGKSPSNHHLGEYVFFSKHLMQIQDWGLPKSWSTVGK